MIAAPVDVTEGISPIVSTPDLMNPSHGGLCGSFSLT